jgi:hypothetical protein
MNEGIIKVQNRYTLTVVSRTFEIEETSFFEDLLRLVVQLQGKTVNVDFYLD